MAKEDKGVKALAKTEDELESERMAAQKARVDNYIILMNDLKIIKDKKNKSSNDLDEFISKLCELIGIK